MCTLTLIATGSDGYRLVHSRDELRTRAPGEPPAWHDASGGAPAAIMPRDPDAGGTWIATTEAGLSLAMLNVNPGPGEAFRAQDPTALRSRGLVVGAVLEANPADPEGVMRVVDGLTLSEFKPFRIVAVAPATGGPVAAELRWDGARPSIMRHAGGAGFRPLCWVSSGLGDAKVEPRLPLFERVVGSAPSPRVQDRFHRHRWPARPEISVLMSRADARTVGITTVEVDAVGARPRMRYAHLDPEVTDHATVGSP